MRHEYKYKTFNSKNQKLYSANNWIATLDKLDSTSGNIHQKLYSANNWIATRNLYQIFYDSNYIKSYIPRIIELRQAHKTYITRKLYNQKLYSANNWIATGKYKSRRGVV